MLLLLLLLVVVVVVATSRRGGSMCGAAALLTAWSIIDVTAAACGRGAVSRCAQCCLSAGLSPPLHRRRRTTFAPFSLPKTAVACPLRYSSLGLRCITVRCKIGKNPLTVDISQYKLIVPSFKNTVRIIDAAARIVCDAGSMS